MVLVYKHIQPEAKYPNSDNSTKKSVDVHARAHKQKMKQVHTGAWICSAAPAAVTYVRACMTAHMQC